MDAWVAGSAAAEIDEAGLQVDGQAHAEPGEMTGGDQGESTQRKVEPEQHG